ncbi:hypothetical protein [Vibrio kanaloae]|uniref:Molecular chaperone n=1 Tax=Vibrio kanaloae TaxID=170673 RepID=A0A4U1WBT9_9VIBR|nr:hypothetical protein [Vibrio kanaloae]TKE89617.1 hypothetical protein FCV44_21350 [Vibrio kanaloae]TKF12471.1 hypothetical protein FCV47_20840 [Vibrio kanaloae]TKF23664.1 hypothetical protein FCV52_17380 [Vibrio kanaloae]
MNVKYFSVKCVLLLSLFSSFSYSFNVNKMMVISDENGNGVITLNNDEDRPLFIDGSIQEVEIINGKELVKKDYVRNNIADWKLTLTNSKFVLKPGESKDIGIRSLCHNVSCDTSKDLTFLLPFSPSHYRENDDVKESTVEINYGFAPVFVIPTPNPSYKYEVRNLGEQLLVKNDSNTLINVFIDACSTKNKNYCEQRYTVVAEREKIFSLPSTLQAETLGITVTNHDRSYKEEYIAEREL